MPLRVRLSLRARRPAGGRAAMLAAMQAVALTLGACGPAANAPEAGAGSGTGSANRLAADAADAGGAALEASARRIGLVADAAVISPVGLYRRRHEAGLDSLCLSPGASGAMRFGLDVSFGEHIHCRGAGEAKASGDRLVLSFAGASCIVVADYQGDRIAFPGALDTACKALCTERGSLEGVAFPRVSRDASIATSARARDGALLCPA